MGKEILVISDIHGRGEEFKYLVRRLIRYMDRYKIILLGDYIGYGTDNLLVIKVLKYLKENCDCIVLKGNWEDMLYLYVKEKRNTDSAVQSKISDFIQRGGVKTANELFGDRKTMNYFLELIELMPSCCIEKINNIPYIFAHSGIDVFKHSDGMKTLEDLLSNQDEEDLLWNFDFYSNMMHYQKALKDMPFNIVAGHVPTISLNPDNPKAVYGISDKVFSVDFGASRESGAIGIVDFSKESLPCIFQDVGSLKAAKCKI